jgi:predicted dehydrogenase
MHPIRFGIIGGGWRSQFFLRVARELPERFSVEGMVVRDAEKGAKIEAVWGVKTYRELDELLRVPDLRFVVVSVPWSVAPLMIHTLTEQNMPALVETPPTPDLPGLVDICDLARRGAKIQVAEQYHLQPLHATRLVLAASGKLGTITQAQVAVAHGYHGISLIRKFLGVQFEPVAIHAHRFVSPIVAGPHRNTQPTEETIKSSAQTIAYLDFGEKLGIFDFHSDQYYSWIRSPRLLIRGERGEIHNTEVRYLADFRTPVNYTLMRQDAAHGGNMEGFYLKGFFGGNEWLYTNPFQPARLSDDEIAVAGCLEKMNAYLDGAPDFYSLAEAAQDHYLNLLIEQAVTSRETVRSVPQPWNKQ